ncbi:pyridoxal phosphate-dependent transferase [Cladochytrium replicatum]|nr:pyridoxal phosphate-dependent transferase [Cladochytrium replicatum]
MVHNFSAGPGVLPRKVLERAQRELVAFGNSGVSVLEMSHRSPEFEGIIGKAEADYRALLNIPSNYKVLFMQGGATAQFSAIVYNLIGSGKGDLTQKPVDFVVTGGWSERCAQEAALLGAKINYVINTKPTKHDGSIPPHSEWRFSGPDAAFVFYCENETVHGVEFDALNTANTTSTSTSSQFPFHLVPKGVPLVCDMSSNMLSRPFDVTKFACIFAGAQKNMGPAGVTVVIVRDDMLARRITDMPVPTILDYKIYAENQSLYNTPPAYSIYICGLVYDWLRNEVGGVEAMEKLNKKKATLLYDTIEQSGGFYRCAVKPGYRSNMNVPFRIYGADGKPSEEVEKKFAKESEAAGLLQLKGHRSVGGIRASLYNALTIEAVRALVEFMVSFKGRN